MADLWDSHHACNIRHGMMCRDLRGSPEEIDNGIKKDKSYARLKLVLFTQNIVLILQFFLLLFFLTILGNSVIVDSPFKNNKICKRDQWIFFQLSL